MRCLAAPTALGLLPAAMYWMAPTIMEPTTTTPTPALKKLTIVLMSPTIGFLPKQLLSWAVVGLFLLQATQEASSLELSFFPGGLLFSGWHGSLFVVELAGTLPAGLCAAAASTVPPKEHVEIISAKIIL